MNWKLIAIIFIILTILESLFLIWLFVAGGNTIENENECAYNICSDDNYDAYLYDDYDKVCYCYIDGEIEHSEYVT